MSVDNTPTGIVYTVTNGEAGQQYPLTFPYIKDDDVRAYYVHGGTQVTMSLGPGYSVSGQTFTASIALPVGAKLAIYRETDITQEILWVDGQAVYTPDIMQADDKLTFIVQEIAGDVKRAVKVSREEEAGGSTPGDLLAGIYAARDDAQNASNAAETAKIAAGHSATDAAESAHTAALTVITATEAAISAATAQANAAAASATDAALSALEAAEAVPENLVPRVTAVEGVASAAQTTANAAKAITDTVTPTPTANAVPQADANGRIDPRWCGTPSRLFASFNTSEPDGLLCNGGAYSRTTYAGLYAVLGTAFGAGNGSTTFNVPDFRGRTVQGANANLMEVLAAGLPNIFGRAGMTSTVGLVDWNSDTATSGAFRRGAAKSALNVGISQSSYELVIDAHAYNIIYGASTTVQTPAIAANIFIKY